MKIGLRQLVMVGGVLFHIGIATDTLWAEEKTAVSGEESQPQQGIPSGAADRHADHDDLSVGTQETGVC